MTSARFVLFVALFAPTQALSLAVDVPPQPKNHAVELNGHVFTLPQGFTIELVAGPPLVNRPISAAFDEKGRLYVSDSSGTNDKVQVQLEQKPHRVVRLADTKSTGKFGSATIFADKMMFPEGVMWLDGSLYVAAPPSIWKLTDTDGDGVADQREEWFKGKTLTGCANDLHGPFHGPDGWIYWCKGAFAEQTYERPGKPPFKTKAAHVFRARPDGTGIEPVMTGGMDNPVGLCFTPGGERIVCGTFFQHPAGGHRDGLIHAVYGGVYGKDHDVVYDHPWTSPHLMPIMTHLGPAAPAAVIRYESTAFGPEYKDNLFCALFNLHKVTRHVLIPDGATFHTRDEDFLVSNNVDFHPTDVVEDRSDGSLLVIDTGGWYKLCCPTSQFHKPDVLGAIYRVRKVGGGKGSWVSDVAVRRDAVWLACQGGTPAGLAQIRDALTDADEVVRQRAIHAASVHRDAAALPGLLNLLLGPSLQNRRAAAEAIGRIGDSSAVPALLGEVGRPCDRVLEHSLTFALIEIGDRESIAAGFRSGNLRVRRAALTALDQMPRGHLDAAAVTRELNAADPALKETAWWIAGHHPEWGDEFVAVLRDRFAARLPPTEQEDLSGRLAALAKSPAVQSLLAEQVTNPVALHAMARTKARPVPDSWVGALARALSSADGDLLRDAVHTIRALNVAKQRAGRLTQALLTIADRPGLPEAVRLDALAAVSGGLDHVTPPRFEFLRDQLRPERSVAGRTTAADVLSKAKLSKDQLLVLCDAVKAAGPLEAERLLDAYPQSMDEAVGSALVAALKASNHGGLRVAAVRPRLAKFGPAVQKQAEELYAALNADEAQQKAKLEGLLAETRNGDVRRGQQVFHGAKAACSTCHAVGYVGGHLGPDLTKIGSIRTERDLLESIVFPSASFVRSYEPIVVTTKSGKQHNGLLRKDAADEVVIATGADQEVHIPRAEVDEMQPSTVSVMPAGLDQQLSRQELADLVAFLKACK